MALDCYDKKSCDFFNHLRGFRFSFCWCLWTLMERWGTMGCYIFSENTHSTCTFNLNLNWSSWPEALIPGICKFGKIITKSNKLLLGVLFVKYIFVVVFVKLNYSCDKYVDLIIVNFHFLSSKSKVNLFSIRTCSQC